MKKITLASITSVLVIIFPGKVISDYICNGRYISTALLQPHVNRAYANMAQNHSNVSRPGKEPPIHHTVFNYIDPETVYNEYKIKVFFNNDKKILDVQATLEQSPVECTPL